MLAAIPQRVCQAVKVHAQEIRPHEGEILPFDLGVGRSGSFLFSASRHRGAEVAENDRTRFMEGSLRVLGHGCNWSHCLL